MGYKSRINRLLSKYNKKLACDNPEANKLGIPKNWTDFVKLTKIRSGTKIVLFNPYDYQQRTINLIENNQFTLIAKARQLGVSQIVISWFLFKAVTDAGFTGIVLSKNQSDSSNLARRIKEMFSQLSDYFEFESDSLLHMKVQGGGQIFFKNSSIEATRGIDSVTAIFFDEAAFVPNIDMIFGAALPCTEMSGDDARIIIASTPNGLGGNWFGEKLVQNCDRDPLTICKQISEGAVEPFQYFLDRVNWCKVFIHWKAHPIYSKRDNYLEDIALKKGQSIEIVKQEYDLSFTDTDESVFPVELIYKIKDENLEFEKSSDGNSLYFLSIDAAGIGDDFFVAQVWKEDYVEVNQKEFKKVLKLAYQYRKRDGSTDSHILKLLELIDNFQIYAVGIETNSIGQVIYERLVTQRKNIEYHTIKTTKHSKQAMIERVIYLLERNQIKTPPNEKYLVGELANFRNLNGRFEAGTGFHDDTVMALCFAADVWTEYSLGRNKSFF